MAFYDVVERAAAILRRQRRLSYRALRLEFGLDDEQLAAVREELVEVLGVAVDRDGKLLESIEPSDAPPAEAAPARDGGLSDQEAERRTVTLLFCDIVSSTELSTRVDPEDLRALMSEYRAACGAVIERHGGVVAQWVGDGMDAYFGYPTAREDDARVAVDAAYETLRAVAAVSARFESERGIRIEARVGVHTGAAVVGHLEGRRDRVVVVGEAPNVCGRIQALAAPGTVAISGATHALVQGYYDVADLGVHALKGVSRPVHVYRVLAPRAVHGRIDVAAARGLTPLVDREGERAALDAAMRGAAAGRARALVLRGEAGIGKSRLAFAARERAAAEGWRVLDCRCSPYHQATALHPVRDGLRELLGADDAAAARGRIARALAATDGADVGETASLLAALLELPGGADDALAAMTPQRQRQRTLEAIAALARAESRSAPLLWIVEDLHWVDPSTEEALGLALEATRDERVLFLLTTRPEHESPLAARADVTTVLVDRLGRDDAETLVRRTAGAHGLAADLVDRLAARADGVPLFLEEMTRTVVEVPGPTSEHGGGAPLDEAELDAAIPATLYGCLMARLDRLSDVRVVAQLAGCIGRTFAYRLLRAVVDVDDDALRRSLDQLVDAGILFRAGRDPESTYTFKHALIQDAATQALLRSVARQYHLRIAEALVRGFGDGASGSGGAPPEEIARHYTAAGRAREAAGYWQQAGLQALQRFANVEAISHLRRALEQVRTLPEGPERAPHEMGLQTLLAVPLTLTRGWASPEVEAAYRRAHELSPHVGAAPQLFPAHVGLLTYYLVSAQHATAYEMGVRNLALAERSGDAELLLEAEHDRGTTSYYMGRFAEALEHTDRAIAIYEPSRHHHHVHLYGKDPGAIALLHAGMAALMLGRGDDGLRRARAAVTLAEAWPHPFTHVWTLAGLSVIHHMRGEVDAVGEVGGRVAAMGAEQGFPNWLAQGLVYTGWATAMRGGHADGVARIEEGLRIWNMTGARLMTPYLMCLLAEALHAAGRDDEALATVERSLALAAETGQAWWSAAQHRLHGDLLLARDREAALRAYREALAAARAQGARTLELRALAALARALPHDDAARDALAAHHGTFGEGFDMGDLVEARDVLAQGAARPVAP